MRLKFWKRPRYFDFEKHRTPQVILHEFISGILTAIWGIVTSIGSAFSATSVTGIAIGGTVYGVSGGILTSIAAMGVSMALSTLANSLMTKSGDTATPVASGGLLLYQRKEGE